MSSFRVHSVLLPGALLSAGFGLWPLTGSVVPLVLAQTGLYCLPIRHAVAWTSLLLAGALPAAAAWSPTPAHDILAVCAALALGLTAEVLADRDRPAGRRRLPLGGNSRAAPSTIHTALAEAGRAGAPLAVVLCESQRLQAGTNRTLPLQAPALVPLLRAADTCVPLPQGRVAIILNDIRRHGVSSVLHRLKPLKLRAGVVLCDYADTRESGDLIARAEAALRAAREGSRSEVYAD